MKSNQRILIVDALRGFALMMIVLIHFVEHFDFFRGPDTHFLFSPETDGLVMHYTMLMISGKAYSIFALLFGFSFFIQLSRKEDNGIDFRPRFLWRLTILLVMGFVNSLIYKGDILHIYAVMGMVLLMFYKVNTKVLYALTILFALQIPTIINLILSFTNPDFTYQQSWGMHYWAEGNEIYRVGSFRDVVGYNFWKGRATVWGWTFYNGRYLQLIALFLLGLIIGRRKIFENLEKYSWQLWFFLGFGAVGIFLLSNIKDLVRISKITDIQKQLFEILIGSYTALVSTAALMALIILIYKKFNNSYLFRLLAAYGKLSLTNYITQAVFGVFFFYGFGLAMYKYLGSTWSLFLGFIFFYIQALISLHWTKHFRYGPFEHLWRKLTFIGAKK